MQRNHHISEGAVPRHGQASEGQAWLTISINITIENHCRIQVPSVSTQPEVGGSLKQGLHQDGRRLTPQRRRILELFESLGSGRHLSAEDVHHQLLDRQSKVSLATIYRTLRLLVEMGFLQELETSNGSRFELADAEHIRHHHLVCVRCGRTEDFESEAVLNAGLKASTGFGFDLIGSSLTVSGICPQCQ